MTESEWEYKLQREIELSALLKDILWRSDPERYTDRLDEAYKQLRHWESVRRPLTKSPT